MEHVAIDLGGKESQICVRSSDGVILVEKRLETAWVSQYLKKRPPSRVILETCAEAFAIADQALALGHEVRVVPATLVKGLGVGHRGVKNDRIDAQRLSETSCRIDLPSVHVASAQSRELKSLCSIRETTVAARTQLINSVRGWLRTQLLRIRTGATRSFPARVRQYLASADQAAPGFVESALRSIEALTAEIDKLDDSVDQVASKHPICRLLRTAPIGPNTAVRFVAAIDQIERFASAHALESYLGLTPGEHFSGSGGHRTGISKAGAKAVRAFLIQSSWSAWRRRPNDPLVIWAKDVALRRGPRVAIVALARKLAGILYAMWRDGTCYDPFHATRANAQTP